MSLFEDLQKFCTPHGSRFHGCNRPDSDYDFLAEDTAKNRETLESLGFKYHRWPNSFNNPHHGGNYYMTHEGKLIDVTLTGNIKSDLAVRDHFQTVLSHINKDKRDHLYAAVAALLADVNKKMSIPMI
jgi:hypothetical protein